MEGADVGSRPSSSRQNSKHSTSRGPRHEDLDVVVAEVVSKFKEGRQQEALELATSFALQAKQVLGESDPVTVNALATVAALLDRLGAPREAEALLAEAEGCALTSEEGSGESQPPSPSSASSWAGSWGDAECDGDNADPAEETDAGEMEEAKAITCLTVEVNRLLQKGLPQEAARHLAAQEQVITSNSGASGVGKAAFHTLWASVLGAVGEEKQAQALYEEAMLCLEVEAYGPQHADLSDTTDTSSDAEDSADEGQLHAARDEAARLALLHIDEEGPTKTSREDLLEESGREDFVAESGREPGDDSRCQPSPPPTLPCHHGNEERRLRRPFGGYGSKLEKGVVSALEAPEAEVISPLLGTAELPSSLGHPVHAATVAESLADRECLDGAPEVLEVTHSKAQEETQSRESAKPSEAPDTSAPQEDEEQRIKSALTLAEHLSGVLSFERAADELEEILKGLAVPGAMCRHTDLHVECFAKYARILWWGKDPEGSIDAFTAADEILVARPGNSSSVQLRRADLWLQLAQVHRTWGDLEAADEHLSDAVSAMEELLQADPTATWQERSPLHILRDAQAALAQVCVQRKDFARAEVLYMQAFQNEAGRPPRAS